MKKARTSLLLVTLLFAQGCLASQRTPTVPAAGSARAGGTLRVGISAPSGVDPAIAADASAQLIVSTMCDTVIQLDPETGEIKLGIGRIVTVGSEGGALIVAMHREELMSDGSKLQSVDASFALSRLANAATASPFAELPKFIRGYGLLRGEDPRVLVEPKLGFREGIRIIDPWGFEIRLIDRSSDFVRLLAHPATAPILRSQALDKPREFAANPICHGPYKLEKPWSPDDTTIALVRSEHYHGKSTAYTRGGRGYADRIEFKVYANEEDQYQAFLRDEIDIAAVPTPRYAEAKASGNLKERRSPATDFIGVPVSRAPFNDRRARVALSQALDRTKLADEVYAGRRDPATAFLPAAIEQQVEKQGGCGKSAPAAPDVRAAKATLVQKKARSDGIDINDVRASPGALSATPQETKPISFEGVSMPFYFNDEFDNAAVVNAIATQWRDSLGLDLVPTPMSWDDFLAKATTGVGLDGFFRIAWKPSTPSPDSALLPLLGADATGPNLAKYLNDDIVKTSIGKAWKETDHGDRMVAYIQAEQAICSEMPLIPVATERHRFVFQTGRIGSAREDLFIERTGRPALRELFVRQ